MNALGLVPTPPPTVPPATYDGLVEPLASASTLAPRVDQLFLGLLLLSGMLILLLVGLNLTFLVRYRQGSDAPRPPLEVSPWKIEAGWITATTLVFLGPFFWGAWIYLDQQRPPPDAVEIDVLARQWMWDVRHPDGRREFNTLHLAVGRAVRLRLRSEDVIHSFYVPAFRVKQDVVPGKVVDLWFEPTQPGEYHLFCAEFCGTQHSGMVGRVIVQTPEAHAAWLSGARLGPEVADRGRTLFLRHGCGGCHAPESAIHAPPLEGLAGRLTPLADGSFARADAAYLRDSILEPGKHLVAGYDDVMPSFRGLLSEGELLDLLAYLQALSAQTPAPTKNNR